MLRSFQEQGSYGQTIGKNVSFSPWKIRPFGHIFRHGAKNMFSKNPLRQLAHKLPLDCTASVGAWDQKGVGVGVLSVCGLWAQWAQLRLYFHLLAGSRTSTSDSQPVRDTNLGLVALKSGT